MMQIPHFIPAPAPLLPPAPAPALAAHSLPLAQQPFDHNWPVHYMGKMDIICTDCQALHWLSERNW